MLILLDDEGFFLTKFIVVCPECATFWVWSCFGSGNRIQKASWGEEGRADRITSWCCRYLWPGSKGPCHGEVQRGETRVSRVPCCEREESQLKQEFTKVLQEYMCMDISHFVHYHDMLIVHSASPWLAWRSETADGEKPMSFEKFLSITAWSVLLGAALSGLESRWRWQTWRIEREAHLKSLCLLGQTLRAKFD